MEGQVSITFKREYKNTMYHHGFRKIRRKSKGDCKNMKVGSRGRNMRTEMNDAETNEQHSGQEVLP
jgi:hypothetical protein